MIAETYFSPSRKCKIAKVRTKHTKSSKWGNNGIPKGVSPFGAGQGARSPLRELEGSALVCTAGATKSAIIKMSEKPQMINSHQSRRRTQIIADFIVRKSEAYFAQQKLCRPANQN